MKSRFLRIFSNSAILVVQVLLGILAIYLEDLSRKSYTARKYIINKQNYFQRFWFSEDMITIYLSVLIFFAITFFLVILVLWADKYLLGDMLTLLGCFGLTVGLIALLNSSEMSKLNTYYYFNIVLIAITLLQYLKGIILLKLYANSRVKNH